jgi:tetratricopeptide (TPR) repeat protein
MEFLDVRTLLETSEPQPRIAPVWYAIVAVGLILFFGAAAGRQSGEAQSAFQFITVMLTFLIMLGLPALSYAAIRALRGEQRQVEAVGELAQLRRWSQAALLLENYLSRPARSGRLRSQALIYLGLILARFHRFDDAVTVNDYLIENELVDPGTAYGLKLGRAMAMLREDHLFDADRAISELRRMSAGIESAGLAIVEIYRHVKTGHPDDAIALFNAKLPAIREQLGHRASDAYALIARAYDLLERQSEAADAFQKATLLAPLAELLRRYPELQKLSGRFQPAPAPPEAM